MQKWITRKQLAEAYGLSVRTVDRRLREMQQLIGIRYPEGMIVKVPGVRICEDAAADYFENIMEIRLGIARPFERRKT